MKIVGALFYLVSLYFLLWYFVSGQTGSAIGFINLLCTGSLFFFLGTDFVPQKKWFRAKYIGYGWGLATGWRGWAIYSLFIAAMAFAVIIISTNTHSISDMVFGLLPTVGLLVGTLFAICYKYGEKPELNKGLKKLKI